MREYLSPGIYSQEYDRSFLETAPVSGPSAVFVGGFTKGQAFIPMQIKDTKELLQRTGQPNGKFFSQYAAYEYSKHKGNFWVQRLLWEEGYTSSAYAVVASGSGALEVLAILAPIGTGSIEMTQAGTMSVAGSDSFDEGKQLVFTAGDRQATYTMSADDVLNIESVIGKNPVQPGKYVYLMADYSDLNTFSGSKYETVSIVSLGDSFIDHEGMQFKHARTPWIKNLNGNDLFQIHHIGDGDYTNKDIKIAIENVNTSSTLEYSKFDVVVRQYDDTDKKPVILQTYFEVDLNPQSDAFIGKKIGDMFYEYDQDTKKLKLQGDYPNKSKRIRVELAKGVKSGNVDKKSAPYMTDLIPAPYSSSEISDAEFIWEYPTVDNETGSWPTRKNFKHQGYDTSKQSIMALSRPMGNSASVELWEDYATTKSITFTDDYIIPLYGGFDGKNPTTGYVTDKDTLMGFDVTSATSVGVETYKKALDMLRNIEEFDIDVISIAGVNIDSDTGGKKKIFEYALEEVCEFRGDCIVVGDATETDEMSYVNAAAKTEGFDSSYGAVYYPAVKIYDTYTKTYPTVPVSTFIPAVIAYTEKISQPHYAPAGINRGTLDVVQAVNKLSVIERDLLYKNQVNPIASFAANGTVVWGQKTLQKAASALDRLNVRILINRIKKWVESYGKTVLFDNNTTTLRQVFTLGVENYLDGLVANNGLYAYKFQMDENNNTPEVIDKNQLVGEVWLKPTKTAQFIIIPINIVRSDTEL